MELFQLEGATVSFSPQALAIKEFGAIWDRDDSDGKRTAFMEMSYVYFHCDWQSVYNEFSDDEKDLAIKGDLFGDDPDWVRDEVVRDAMLKYKELRHTRATRMVIDANFAVDKVRRYFREVDLTERDEKTGKPIHSAKDLMGNIKQVGDLLKGLKTLEEEVRKEEVESSKIRGGGQAGMFED